jgi:GNAT superfamily N-acetyltransferase
MNNMTIKVCKGREAKNYLPQIAELRMEVFRDFPYLYEGSVKNEEEYLGRYMEAPGFMTILAIDKQKIVGVSTCLPLEEEIEEITKPFNAEGISLESVLYFGESVLKKEYRGQGIGVAFFDARETYGKELGRDFCYFCAVIRPEDHPLKPEGYKNLHSFWKKRGYQPTDLYCTLDWVDLGDSEKSDKTLQFWKKEIKKATLR